MQAMLFSLLSEVIGTQCGSQARSMGNLVLWGWPSTKVGQEMVYKCLLFFFMSSSRRCYGKLRTSLHTTSSSKPLHWLFLISCVLVHYTCSLWSLKKNYLHWNFFLMVSFTVIHNWYFNKYHIRQYHLKYFVCGQNCCSFPLWLLCVVLCLWSPNHLEIMKIFINISF